MFIKGGDVCLNPDVVKLNLKRKEIFTKWKELLTSRNITNFSAAELKNIDVTIGIFNSNDELIATGSCAGNVLKYVAVKSNEEQNGATFNKIVTELMDILSQRGIFHIFVFTKPMYSSSFQYIGFNELASSKFGVILEKGDHVISDYIQSIPQKKQQSKKRVAAIVMNANPFTNGHLYLAETAALENDLVYIFVVNNDVSLFSTNERVQLVKLGTKHLDNVIVVNGSDYMVSYATFPAYFLDTVDEIIQYQTTLDARIFRDQIAPPLNIKKRYLGTEPYSRTTSIYNNVLQKELPPIVEPVILKRKLSKEGKIITATEVRMKIQAGKIKDIRDFVPVATYDFIVNNINKLQERIRKGMKISGN